MLPEHKIGPDYYPVGDNLDKATVHLDAYLEKPEEVVLREHQVDVVESLRNFFARGESAGYVSLPTGSGKTVVAVELAKALDMRTVILSPTQTILRQTSKTFEKHAPELTVSNFYAAEKDLSGQVLNTTYQSFLRLLDTGKFDASQIELLICDEAHLALGEERHKVFRQVPSVLMVGLTATPYFNPLDGYLRRGIVSENEKWTGLFKNQIHEMGLEEAIQRGVLAQLDVHMVRTNINVDDIETTTTGDYTRWQLEKYLNREARNYLTVGMIAGLESLPPNISISDQQKREIIGINQKIGGKQTAIFGISINHVEHLRDLLQSNGIGAEVIHSKVSLEKRQAILDAYGNGDIQVILGVDMLRLGWDSPETEVGIYLAPTFSGIVAVQELGRILRISEQAGKEKAIAIQFVDEFTFRGQAPVLIPNIFDPYYVLRGIQTGEAQVPHQKTEKKIETPITFSGLGVETIIEEAFTNQLLKERFKQGSILEMSSIIDRIIEETLEKFPQMSVVEFYKLLESNIPRISAERQNEALQAVASIDSNVSKVGKKVLLFTSLGTIFGALEPYFEDDESENCEIIEEAISEVLMELDRPGRKVQISHAIYFSAQDGAARYIASREGMPFTWVKNKNHKKVLSKVDDLLLGSGGNLSVTEVERLTIELAQETGISENLLVDAIMNRLQRLKSKNVVEEEDEIIEDMSSTVIMQKFTEIAPQILTARERKVLELRFGLVDGKFRTYDEVGEIFRLTGSRAQQLVHQALSRFNKSWARGQLREKLVVHLVPDMTRREVHLEEEEKDEKPKVPASKIPIGERWPTEKGLLNMSYWLE